MSPDAGGEPAQGEASADRSGSLADALTVRPHWLFVLFFPIRQYSMIVVFTVVAWAASSVWGWLGIGPPVVGGERVFLVGGAVLFARFVWAVLELGSRAYGVDGDGVVWGEVGVLNRTRSDVRLGAVRAVTVDRPFFQRLFGLGSIGFASAGTGGYEVVWRVVRDPSGLASRVRSMGAG